MARLVRTPAALDHAVRTLAQAPSVALDTEFHPERQYFPQLMLVQLRAEGDEPLLVDPLDGLDLRPLGEVLAAVPVLLHGGSMDIAILKRVTGFAPNVVFDTQVMAGWVGFGFPIRLQELAREFCALQMRKAETLSDWSLRPLSPDQLRYAADDVLVLHGIRDGLLERLTRNGTLEAALACQAELVELALAPEDDEAAWQGVQGAHLLDEGERRVLVELARWRQQEARGRNIPRHSIVPDSVLVDISRRQPETIDVLRMNRRMPSSCWKKEGDAILRCVALGRTRQAPPPLTPAGRPRGWMDLVRAAARVAEARSGVAAELLAPDRIVSSLGDPSRLAPWRRDQLGDDFFEFLKGYRPLQNPWPTTF
jgi:ribonuclease D